MGRDSVVWPTVTVAIPTIPVRKQLLQRAVSSVSQQTRLPRSVIVVEDTNYEGPAATRNRCLSQVKTDYVAWLDDDDYLHPNHLELCVRTAIEHGADFVYPWYTREDHYDPFRVDNKPLLGRAWDDRLKQAVLHENNFIPITTLIRTELLRSVGGFPTPGSEDWPHRANEDWGCWKRLLLAGAKFAHCPHQTWEWCRHGVDRRPKGRVGQ